MQPRVTAILVARNGEAYLERTIAGLAAQTRPVDALVVVDAASTDNSATILAHAGATQFTTVSAVDYGQAVSQGLSAAAPPESDRDEWLWLLGADTVPEPRALEVLLAAVEIAPSVAVAGPKVVDPADRALIHSYGVSMSNYGATIPLVDRELDQAQHDIDGDVLGVSSSGMLVRRAVWFDLDGFDPGLPTVDAGLDFSVRARLAGHRVVRVPHARVSRAVPLEDFGRRRPTTARTRRRWARAAQLHRRLVYAPAGALLFHWLSLVPIAIGRSIVHLLAKRPGAVGGEFATAFVAAFNPSKVIPARRRLKAQRTTGWAALAALRIPPDDVRERRATARERLAASRADASVIVRAEFFSGGGIWVVVLAGLVSLVTFFRLLGAPAIQGGATLPLASEVSALWSRLGHGWREIGEGFMAPADPFAGVLAILGSFTFWSPSLSLVILWLVALPLAALGGWWCATRWSERAWPPAVAAALWAFSPPFLVALADGRVAAVIAHLVLPWLVLAAIEGARSWSAAATASVLFAVVTACSPSLAPALLVAWLAWVAARPRSAHRLLGIPIPAVALFLPLVAVQLMRGTPLGLLADPGVVRGFPLPTGWQLTVGEPAADAVGWASFAQALGLDAGAGFTALIVLIAPLALLALAGVFLRGSRRAIPSLLIALLGLVTALLASRISVTADGADAVALWPGAGLSLYWLGLVGAAVAAVDALRRAGVLTGLVVVTASALAIGPVVAAGVLDEQPVRPGEDRILPALVNAEAVTRPDIGTLVVSPQADGSISATLERGEGTTLDDMSTFAATRTELTGAAEDLAELAGNLASTSGFDPAPPLEQFGIEYVVVTPPSSSSTDGERAVWTRTTEALDAVPELEPVGSTSAGLLWRYPVESAARDIPDRGATGTLVLTVQAIVFIAALLLAIPTRLRRRVAPAETLPGDDPADTFDEDDRG
ncbi:MAG: glycosyltransferase family 2 protein [Microbacteriaceae bacterium]